MFYLICKKIFQATLRKTKFTVMKGECNVSGITILNYGH